MASTTRYSLYTAPVGLTADLENSLRAFAAAGPAEVREAGARVGLLPGLSWEVRGAADRPLLHLWSEGGNLTRRVLAIEESSEARLIFTVARFGRAKPGRLEFLRLDFEPSSRAVRRENYSVWLANVLAQKFPDEKLESLSSAADLEHSLSGNYARGVLRRGPLRWALLAVPDGESSSSAENSLAFALLWLERVRQTLRGGAVAGLRLILPRNSSAAVAHRLAALDSRLPVELYEQDTGRETLSRMDPRSAANERTWLVPARDAESLLAQARPALEPLLALSPVAPTFHPHVETREVWLRFRGLSFARWKEGRSFFGLDGARQELSPATQPALGKLLKRLDLYRSPQASSTRHALYRAQPERWLESLVHADPTAVDASLHPDFLYAQVFAGSPSSRGIIDLLGVTRSGRLAILELKATEHLQLPLQAADYWLRVRDHQLRDELPSYGYFCGIALQPAPPLVFLVAPAIRFHPSTDTLLRFLSPEIEVRRVGLAESWRRGLRVALRQ